MADVRNRPLSPHLQVYRPQITTVLSITHRATGIVLSLGCVFLVLWLLAAAAGPRTFEIAQDCAGSALGYVFLFVFSVALFYHLLNGIRHLFWDMGHGFEMETATRTGWAVVVGAVVLTAIAWILGLQIVGGM